jgi:hypothetical protein
MGIAALHPSYGLRGKLKTARQSIANRIDKLLESRTSRVLALTGTIIGLLRWMGWLVLLVSYALARRRIRVCVIRRLAGEKGGLCLWLNPTLRATRSMLPSTLLCLTPHGHVRKLSFDFLECDLRLETVEMWGVLCSLRLAEENSRRSILMRQHSRRWLACPTFCPQRIPSGLDTVGLELVLWLLDFKMHGEPEARRVLEYREDVRLLPTAPETTAPFCIARRMGRALAKPITLLNHVMGIAALHPSYGLEGGNRRKARVHRAARMRTHILSLFEI